MVDAAVHTPRADCSRAHIVSLALKVALEAQKKPSAEE